jgi:Zn-dependent protease
MERLPEFPIWYAVFLFTLAFHEGAHALFAFLGGDRTAYHGGQVTLNPIPHMRREPFGTVVVPVLSFFLNGWMMGWASTPYDPDWGRRHPSRLALMSAAGPIANLILATASFVLLRVLLHAGYFVPPNQISFSHMVAPAEGGPNSTAGALGFLLSVALNLNVMLFLFNLLPLPPLDGAGVLRGLFPGSVGQAIEGLQRQPMFAIMGLLVAWQVFGPIERTAFQILLSLLHPGVGYGYH